MLNYLLDASIKTMIGLLPSIINHNNRAIENEFSEIYDTSINKIIKSVYAPSGSVKAHKGEFVNLHVDYLTVNSIDSLVDSLLTAKHNYFKNRFSLNINITDENKDKYSHDASTIIFDVSNGRITTVYLALLNLINGDNVYGTATKNIVYGTLTNILQEDSSTFDDSIYSMNRTQLIRNTNLPKWQQYDILAGIKYTYHTGGSTITITDDHINAIDGNIGEIKSIKFKDNNINKSYKVLLSRKELKYLMISKSDLVRVKLICENYTEEYGAEWDVDSYSIKNPSDIEIIYK